MKMATRATSARSTSDAAVHTNAELRRVALAGLRGTPKTLPCSLFYDDAGAALFEQICDTPEYYPTRTEIGILRDNLAEITAAIGMNARLVELGSGEAVKTRILLRQLDAIEYVPVDISRTQLQETAQCMARDFPRVRVRPICGDYTQRLLLPAAVAGVARTAIFFPGSTIGNFEPADAEAFLRSLANLIAW